MTPTKDRRRAAARARLEREMAERAAKAHKRRQIQAVIGAGAAVVVLVAGVIWLVTSLGDDSAPPAAAGSSATPGPVGCQWTAEDTSANPNLKNVGTPPTSGEPRTGRQTMTITLTQGVVTAELDLSKVPCTASSFTFLASKKFFDGSKCHRLTTEGLKVLQCGDPTGTGSGGPTYKMTEENKPEGQKPTYPRGAIAMANTGQPGSTGSQFFIVYGDSDLSADYTLLGTITSGLDVIEKIAAAGHNGKFDPSPGGGEPKQPVVITSLTMSAVGGSAPPGPTSPGPASPAATTPAAGSPSP